LHNYVTYPNAYDGAARASASARARARASASARASARADAVAGVKGRRAAEHHSAISEERLHIITQ
jgi:hypothetical protein